MIHEKVLRYKNKKIAVKIQGWEWKLTFYSGFYSFKESVTIWRTTKSALRGFWNQIKPILFSKYSTSAPNHGTGNFKI